ncbi:MAG: hypothetical protein ACYDBX_03685 [Patescibacteria group bacterium]
MNYVWYSNNKDEKSPDSLHQTFVYGSLDSIMHLKRELGEEESRKLFLTYPKKMYTKASLNFIKHFVLNIEFSINENKYLKDTPRDIR